MVLSHQPVADEAAYQAIEEKLLWTIVIGAYHISR